MNLHDLIPFVLSTSGERTKVNITRLVEASVIAVVTAVILNFTALAEIKVQVSALKEQIVKVETQMESIRRDLYVPANEKHKR